MFVFASDSDSFYGKMGITYFQTAFLLDSCCLLGWYPLCLTSFCPYVAVGMNVRSGKCDCPTCNLSAECRAIINESVIQPNANICICRWYIESKSAGGSICQFYCRHRWYPERGKVGLILGPEWSQLYLKYCEMFRALSLWCSLESLSGCWCPRRGTENYTTVSWGSRFSVQVLETSSSFCLAAEFTG